MRFTPTHSIAGRDIPTTIIMSITDKARRYDAVKEFLSVLEPDLEILAHKLLENIWARLNPLSPNSAGYSWKNTRTITEVKNIVMQIHPNALRALVIDTPFSPGWHVNPFHEMLFPELDCEIPGCYIGTFINRDNSTMTTAQVRHLANILRSPALFQQVVVRAGTADSRTADSRACAQMLGDRWHADLDSLAPGQDLPYIPGCYVGYSDNPKNRRMQHQIRIFLSTLRLYLTIVPTDGILVDLPKVILHIIKRENLPLRFYSVPIFAAYHGRIEEAAFAEAILGKLISIRHGAYAWEGGLCIKLWGTAIARGAPIDPEKQLSYPRRFAPHYCRAFTHAMEYIDWQEKIIKEHKEKTMEKELKKVRGKI